MNCSIIFLEYLLLFASLAFVACSGESSSVPTSGNSFYRNENGSVSTPQNINYSNESLTDSRDGQVYNVVTIGYQTWMAQNLNFETDSSSCYNDSTEYCDKYGRLYTWAAAMTACPSGWHLPSKLEWEILLTAVGGASTAEPALKSTSGWPNNSNITNASGFSAIPVGYKSFGSYTTYDNYDAIFWSSTEFNDSESYDMYLCDDHGDAAEILYHEKNKGFSVRCLKN